MTLQQVAFDIETTGFAAEDVVTVVGFAVPMGVHVFLQTGGADAGGVATAVQDRVEETVCVSVFECERALLDAVAGFVQERLVGRDVLLVAFNGETWRGGFDVPFLRTRFSQADVPWPFDVPYADLYPVVTNRFNTTASGGEEHVDLDGVYDVLCDGRYGDVDPFAESAAAVEAFTETRFTPLVLHNVADVLRTRALGRLAEQYCAKSEFNVKSLTATRSM